MAEPAKVLIALVPVARFFSRRPIPGLLPHDALPPATPETRCACPSLGPHAGHTGRCRPSLATRVAWVCRPF